MCNHNLDDRECSLIKSNKIVMTYPPTRDYFCPVCKQMITIKLAEDDVNKINQNNIKVDPDL